MIKCLIFDCDGTLVDSEQLFNRALSEKLAPLGVCISAEVLVERFRGVKLTNILEVLEAEHSISLDEGFVNAYRQLVERIFSEELTACDGVIETLSQIDLAMCVASNGPINKMKLSLSVCGLASFFGDKLFSAYQVNSWKPEPDLFLHTANEMGFKPHECLVVEDSRVGIEAAESAGMRSVLYDPNDVHGEVAHDKKIKYFPEVLNYKFGRF